MVRLDGIGKLERTDWIDKKGRILHWHARDLRVVPDELVTGSTAFFSSHRRSPSPAHVFRWVA